MTSLRKTALVAGVLYLVTFLSSIPAFFLLSPVLDDPSYIVSAGADTQVTAGALLDLVNALACIGTAVALFSVLRLEHEGLAIGFVATRLFEAAVIVIGVVCVLSVVSLRQPGATGAEATSLTVVGQALVAIRDWTFLIGPGIMPGLNAILLGTLLYRSRLVPRWIPTVGLIGAPLLISGALGRMFFGINDVTSAWSAIGTVPIFVWELSVALWMTFKGFDESTPIAAAYAAESARSAASRRVAERDAA
jgi:Domain of unknown function (DUF4386)